MADALGVEGETQALRIVEANRSPRYKKLDQLERFVETTHYDGRPSWYSDDVPLWDRAPCIAYPIVKTAIASNIDMLLGEQSFPAVTAFSHHNDDEELEDEELADRLEWVDRGISELIQKSGFKAAARESYAHAQGARSACCIVGVRNGRLFIDTVRAKWCTPTFDDDGNVLSVEIRYPYIDRVRDEAGKWKAVAKLYKRVIDATSDTRYKPVEARQDGIDPTPWPVDSSIKHGFGFCPVVWYAYRKGCSVVNEFDGQAIHEHCLDEIIAHDFAISQRHTAALFVGQPQICEFGVPPGYNPTDEGAKPDLGAHREVNIGIQAGAIEKSGSWISGRAQPTGARKKGPGYVWQYPDATTCKVEILELNAGSLKALDEHASDIRAKIAESLQVVFLDPEHVKFAATVSGKALRTLRERQYAHCDQDREDFGEGWILPVIKMLLRVVLKVGVKKVKLRFAPELFKALAELAKQSSLSDADDGTTRQMGDAVDEFDIPDLDLKWPDHFMPSPQDDLATVQAVMAATVIPDRIKIQKLSRIFDIDNVDVVLEELAEQKLENQQHELDMQAQLAAGLRDGSTGSPRGTGPGGAKKPPPGRGGNRAGATVAAQGSARE